MIYHVYVGSYMGENGGDGIYLFELDTGNKKLSLITTYPEMSSNPSFLTLTRDQVFAVSELETCGYITSFSRNPVTGELEKRNRIKTDGTAMCHLCVWPDGKYLSASNYMSGSLLVCSVEEDGKIGTICDFIQHSGVGFDCGNRQEGPHMHASGVSPDGKYLYAADLGLDQVFCYQIEEGGTLSLADEALQIHTPDGTGPRHFVFRKDGRLLYLVTEMGNQLFVYETRDCDGAFHEIQSISTLSGEFNDFNLAADIHLSNDEKFLYVSNRGANNIAVFSVSEESGRVNLVGHYSCFGDFPRNFCITPDDHFVLIANQKSGNVVLCERNVETGAIDEKLADIQVSNAVFVIAIQKEEMEI